MNAVEFVLFGVVVVVEFKGDEVWFDGSESFLIESLTGASVEELALV